MEHILQAMAFYLVVAAVGVIFGLGFKLAYNWIDNKTKKVCDMCFRDIKAFNKQYKKDNN